MLDTVAEHFTDSYNHVNSLSSVLCDPNGRQITKSRTSNMGATQLSPSSSPSVGRYVYSTSSKKWLYNIREPDDDDDEWERRITKVVYAPNLQRRSCVDQQWKNSHRCSAPLWNTIQRSLLPTLWKCNNKWRCSHLSRYSRWRCKLVAFQKLDVATNHA